MNGRVSSKCEVHSRFILLTGDDVISRQHAKNDIVDSLCRAHADASIEQFNSDAGTFSDFIERIITPSLFQSMRIFVISDVDLLSEEDLDLLSGLPAYDLTDGCVIMESGKTRGKKGRDSSLSKKYSAWLRTFEAAAEKDPARVCVMEFPRPPDYKMAEWVIGTAARLLHRRMTQQDAEYCVDLIGTDTALLYSELQKIDLYLPAGAAIDRTVIERVAKGARSMTQYELAASLGKKQFDRTLEIIDSFFTTNTYLPIYISAIFRHFWALFRLNRFARLHPDIIKRFTNAYGSYDRQLQEELGLAIGVAAGLLHDNQKSSVFPAIIKSGVLSQAQSFTPAHFKRIFSWLFEYDRGIKTGRIDDSKTGFQLLCFKISRVDRLASDRV